MNDKELLLNQLTHIIERIIDNPNNKIENEKEIIDEYQSILKNWKTV